MAIEFLIPEGLEPERLAAAISSSGLTAEEAGAHVERRVYYDTFDGRLRAAGKPAVHEGGRLTLNGIWTALPQAPERMLASDLDPGPLRQALATHVDVRALLPLAEVEVSERQLRILDGERKTVVRATIERPALPASGEQLRPRLRLAALRGYGKELEHVCTAVEQELGLERAEAALIDEAVTALGGQPGGVSSKVEVALEPSQRTDEAAVVVLRRLLEVIEQNLPGAIADLDSEFLHDFRVAVRRSRSVQRQLRQAFPPEELERFREDFRWVQRVTGDARDLDVYLLEFEDMRALVPASMRPDLDPLREALRQRRLGARVQMVVDLESQRFEALLEGWSTLLDRLASLPAEDRSAAPVPIASVAGQRIVKVYRRMVKEGRAIDPHGPSGPFHELRKRGKELRYLLELFGAPLYPDDVVRPMIKTLKALQNVLGRHQDREVQIATLSSLAGELADDRSALLATGALIASLEDDKRVARAEFAERFQVFSRKEQRALVRDTFA